MWLTRSYALNFAASGVRRSDLSSPLIFIAIFLGLFLPQVNFS